MTFRQGKSVADSAVEYRIPELFSQTHEVFFGGSLLQIVNKVASSVALHHAEGVCEMIGIDFVRFFSPVKKGDILVCKASVNRTWHSSLEIGALVIAEDFSLLEQRKVLSAYFTFSVLDESQKPSKVVSVLPESKEERKRYIEAEKRRLFRYRTSYSAL
ncbi:MAG: hotdog domain-containing protein [Chlamydiota bacterium]